MVSSRQQEKQPPRQARSMPRLGRLLLMSLRLMLALTLTLVGVLGVTAGSLWLLRPSRTPLDLPLYQGVHYFREVLDTPRPNLLHHAVVDLKAPGVRVLVTPANRSQNGELHAQTTREFVRLHGLQLAINGSFFEPFHSDGLFDYYPHPGDPVNVIGQSTSNGDTYSSSDGPRGTLCIMAEGIAVLKRGRCPEGTAQALAGHVLLVENGREVSQKSDKPEPRTVVAISDEGTVLHLMVVDGRQPGYSEGLGLKELAREMLERGFSAALNLDGGGSSTLVKARWLIPELLNSPIHTHVPLRERPVANHLGIFALPVEP